MGYQIQYGQTIVKTFVSERKKFRISRKGTGVLIIVLVILLVIALGSREAVQDFLIPGNSQVTRAAVSKMVSDLKEGEPLSACFEAFCREIVDAANIPE